MSRGTPGARSRSIGNSIVLLRGPLIRESLEIRRAALGDTHLDVAESLEALALNLLDQGDFESPAPLLREAVAMRRELQDSDGPDFARAINNLGFVLLETGEYEEAEELFVEALLIKRRIFDDEHPDIAMGLNNVAAKEKPQKGEIVAVGPGRLLDNGDRGGLSVKVGDHVFFGKYAGSDVKVDGQELKIMRESDILGILV